MARPPMPPEKIDEIINRYQRGDLVKDIAADMGRTRQAIYLILQAREVPRGDRDTRFRPTEPTPHGSPARITRHRREGDWPCEKCRKESRRKSKLKRERLERKRLRAEVREQKKEAERRLEVEARLPEALDHLGRSLGFKE